MKELKKIRLSNILMLTAAGLVNAVGITLFLAPVGLYDSGISGSSMLLSHITPEWLTLSMFLLVLNVPLFLFGLKKQGWLFTVYAIYAVAVYSVCAYLINEVLPVDLSAASPLAGSDLLLCALFGGIISGVGSGLAIRFGGAMDGVEVMAVIFAKRLGITVGNFVMVYNVLLYIACGLILQSWRLPLYSVVTYMAALKTIDFIVEGIDRAKCAVIVTEQPEAVCAALCDAFQSGMTRLEAKGGYSNADKAMLYFVLNRFQISRMKDIVRSHDPAAYIVINEVADVFSKNQPQSV